MIIPLLLAHPEYIDDFDAELLSGTEKAMVSAIKEISKSGITPTKEIIVRELVKNDIPQDVIDWLNDQMSIEPSTDIRYLMHELRENYNTSIYVKLMAYIKEQIGERAPSIDVFRGIEQMTSKIKGASSGVSVSDTSKRTLERLGMIYSGRVPPTWKTGKNNLDESVCFGPKQLVMIAAQQKIGKTRFVLELAMEMLSRNPSIEGINWYTFEMDDVELTMLLAAHIAMIDSNIVNGRIRIPSKEEQDRIKNAINMLREMNIRFVNHKMTMEEYKVDALRHSEGKITIVDNIGLIKASSGREGNAHDDYMASEFVDIRDRTNGLFFLLHHLGKESVGHFNKENLYRPSPKHSRGSNRLNDYVNTLLLLHRIEMYPSLVEEGIISRDDFDQARRILECAVPFSRESGVAGKTVLFRHALEYCKTWEVSPSEIASSTISNEQLKIDLRS